MKIEVTQDHINDGTEMSCDDCPIAFAIQDVTHNWARVTWRDEETAFARIPEGEVTLPDEVKEFIHNFDSGRSVKPFSFDLPIEDATPHIDMLSAKGNE